MKKQSISRLIPARFTLYDQRMNGMKRLYTEVWETGLPGYEGLLPKILPICRQTADHSAQPGRVNPSFFILDWSVVRFIPSLAAAPSFPPIIQLVSCKTL